LIQNAKSISKYCEIVLKLLIADGAIAIIFGGFGHHLNMINYILFSPSHTENQRPAIHAHTSIPPLSSSAFSKLGQGTLS
jgi:hypothetical protein